MTNIRCIICLIAIYRSPFIWRQFKSWKAGKSQVWDLRGQIIAGKV